MVEHVIVSLKQLMNSDPPTCFPIWACSVFTTQCSWSSGLSSWVSPLRASELTSTRSSTALLHMAALVWAWNEWYDGELSFCYYDHIVEHVQVIPEVETCLSYAHVIYCRSCCSADWTTLGRLPCSPVILSGWNLEWLQYTAAYFRTK